MLKNKIIPSTHSHLRSKVYKLKATKTGDSSSFPTNETQIDAKPDNFSPLPELQQGLYNWQRTKGVWIELESTHLHFTHTHTLPCIQLGSLPFFSVRFRSERKLPANSKGKAKTFCGTGKVLFHNCLLTILLILAMEEQDGTGFIYCELMTMEKGLWGSIH